MKALITGIDGFVGSHLTSLLLGEGTQVFGLVHDMGRVHRLQAVADRVDLVPGDVTRSEDLARVLDRVMPDEIYHLAGAAHVQGSWEMRRATYEVNFLAAVNLFEAMKAVRSRARVLVVGSSHEYGTAPSGLGEMPLSEDSPLRPLSPYAVSKVCQEMAAYQASHAEGLDIVMVRPFNHAGPGQDTSFVCADFAERVARIARGEAPPTIEVGDLAPQRDFTDVRDVVRAYRLLLARAPRGEVYNVCSGRPHSIGEVLNLLIGLAGRPIEVREARGRFRAVEIPILVGSPDKIRRAVGWTPAIPFEQTLQDIYDFHVNLHRAGV